MNKLIDKSYVIFSVILSLYFFMYFIAMMLAFGNYQLRVPSFIGLSVAGLFEFSVVLSLIKAFRSNNMILSILFGFILVLPIAVLLTSFF